MPKQSDTSMLPFKVAWRKLKQTRTVLLAINSFVFRLEWLICDQILFSFMLSFICTVCLFSRQLPILSSEQK